MSRSEYFTAGMTAIGISIPLFWVSIAGASVSLFVGIFCLARARFAPTDAISPFISLAIPRLSPLEAAQLEQLRLDRQTKALGQILCIFVQNQKQSRGTNNLIFPEEVLRHELGKDGDRLHAVMGHLLQIGRAKHADAPGYWAIK